MADRGAIRPWLALALAFTAGCSSGTTSSGRAPLDPPAGPINRIAILRLDRAEAATETELRARPDDNPNPRLAPNAETAVTAQLYGVLANDSRWRLAPDLEVEEAMREVALGGSLESRAIALGKATKVDAVISGRVSRFQDRVGTEFGARHPASVAFDLELVETATGNVLWRGSFDQTQRDLSANLLEFWTFWEGRGRFLSAPELARLGIQRLVADMDQALQQ